MISIERTKIRFGYEPKDLAPTTHSPVALICDKCQCETTHAYGYALIKANKHPEQKTFCQKCLYVPRVNSKNKKSALPLPPEVDAELTQKNFGYLPTALRGWSRKLLVVRCAVTKEIYFVPRCALNNMKCVREKGHYISVSGWSHLSLTPKLKKTTLHREKMKSGQQLRRALEKQLKSST
ncbi:MAG: hypothetical protein KF802_02275 [Bdellovibrionaceae bacterium]|nr:hypothetical protein [Pseudobdellovibrionaceae bacterium]